VLVELPAMPRRLFLALFAAVLSAGCFEIFNLTPTNPDPTISFLGGRWESLSENSSALLKSCTNFTWNVTQQQSGTTIGAGTFSATCFGVLQVSGSAQATQAGSAVNWTATGVANGGGITNCQITLSGSATLSGDELTITYSGQTCQGPVSGTETLKLKA
jgi:hypothetical protein